MKDRTISDFFKTDCPAYAAYDNIRKIGSYIDGFKNSSRKLYYSGMKYCDKEYIKTETFSNYSAAYTNYLHGSNNLNIVCVSIVQGFVGKNNYPLYIGNSGGWGCRINPRASAPRYTRLKFSEYAHKFFNDDDFAVVGNQIFEGDKIEPKFFVPIIPMILINGSDGLSTGFAQKILPRNPKDIIRYIENRLSGKENRKVLMPWFKGFKGDVRYNSEGKLEIVGKVENVNTYTYRITEIPIYVEYDAYVETLDKLVEDKVIVDYVDKCDPKTDEILFEIKTTREFSKEHRDDNEYLLKTFKLIKPFTENFNCIDENNRVREFKSAEEIIDAFISIRLEYYQKRKDYLLQKHLDVLKKTYSKLLFCAGVIKGEIVVNNKPKSKIVEQLEKIEKICKVDDSYDYILNMPIYSLSKEMLESMKTKINELKELIKTIKEKTPEDFWRDDLKVLKF